MSRGICLIQAPVSTISGYGDHSREICTYLINSGKYNVKIISAPWGMTPMNALNPNIEKHKVLLDHFLTEPLTKQPDLYIQVTIPSEFQPVGKYNIGITAGIETTAASAQWIEGCNRMDLILTVSEHAKKVLENTSFDIGDKRTGQVINKLKLTKPIDLLPNAVDTSIFKKMSFTEYDETIKNKLDKISEKFCFLFVGHWLKGDIGQDRKDVGMLIKVFLETFKSATVKPALILKMSGGAFSVGDRMDMLRRIEQIKKSIGTDTLPSVYLIHGELTEHEMATLYNHPKVKVNISFGKGEGFGRPLLEATVCEKLVMISGWSGPLDFLDKDSSVLLPGAVGPVHPSAVWENVIIPESQWFTVDYPKASQFMWHVFKHIDDYEDNVKKLAKKNASNFSYNAIEKRTIDILNKYVPEFAVEIPLQLPELQIL